MITFKELCEKAKKEAEELPPMEGEEIKDPETTDELDNEEETEDKKEIELDEFQTRIVDMLSKKYPEAEEDDIQNVAISFSKKVYAKFEPKEEAEESEEDEEDDESEEKETEEQPEDKK